jgi:phage repressor protein C with HTH and peptisase S24 domain
MEPALKSGSFVLVRMGRKNLKKGDIVVLKTSEDLSLKRIHDINPQGYFVRGDNNADSIDSRDVGLIQPHHIMGKAIWF